jgi:hypothetical protein
MLTEISPPVNSQSTPSIYARPASHAATCHSSRLRRVLAVLTDGRWHSTRDLMETAVVCAVNSIIHELRVNGYGIECERRGGVFYYRRTWGLS